MNAFPSIIQITKGFDQYHNECYFIDNSEGMDLRDYFAGQVLQGIYANRDVLAGLFEGARSKGVEAEIFVSEQCYKIADAMLKAREVEK